MSLSRVSVALLVLCLGVGGLGPPSMHAQPTKSDIDASRRTVITEAVKEASPAVVTVSVESTVQVRDPRFEGYSDAYVHHYLGQSPYREEQVKGTGSGFVVSPDGYIVTNEHVIGDENDITVSFPDGRSMEAERVGADSYTDLAVLKVEADQKLRHLTFETNSDPIVGEWVIALGNPFGLFEDSAPSVSVGVVSATGRNLQAESEGRIYRNMIQTDAAISQGNSGGPLVNAEGRVIGVNTAIFSETGGSIGLGFAVPAERAAVIVSELKERGAIDRAFYTGLSTVSVNPEIVEALNLSQNEGVMVHDFDLGSPADEAGIQLYDVIVEIEGTPIKTRVDYVTRLYDFRPGDTVRFTVLREGTPVELTLTLGRDE